MRLIYNGESNINQDGRTNYLKNISGPTDYPFKTTSLPRAGYKNKIQVDLKPKVFLNLTFIEEKTENSFKTPEQKIISNQVAK